MPLINTSVMSPYQMKRCGAFMGIGEVQKQGPEQVLRVGLLGASQVSTYAAIAPARHLPNVQITTVAARDGDRAAKFAKEHRIKRSYGSYTALLDDPEVDAVYVGLPNGLHGQWAAAALSAGKSVLCEKPFTANVDEARHVQALAQAKGLLIREAFHYREHPLMTQVSAQLAAGRVGQLKELHVRVLIPSWVFGGQNIRFQEGLAGGAMMDAGCYGADVLRFLSGGHAPAVVSAKATPVEGCSSVDGAMHATFEFPTLPGMTGSVTASLQHNGPVPRAEIDAVGSRGSMSLSGFIMPFFGHHVEWTTRAAEAAASTSTSAAIAIANEAAAEAAAAAGAAGSFAMAAAMGGASGSDRLWESSSRIDALNMESQVASTFSASLGSSSSPMGSSSSGYGGARASSSSASPSPSANFMASDPLGLAAPAAVATATATAGEAAWEPRGGASLLLPPALRGLWPAANRGVRRTTEFVYGAEQQTTYYHQMSRFATDAQAVMGRGAGHAPGAAQAVIAAAEEEMRASIVNLSTIEQVYAAAGLPVRQPSTRWMDV